jgi:hypothetical protein
MSSTRPSPRKLNCELPFEEFIHPEEAREITSSKTYRDGRWDHLTKLGGFPAGIEKSVLPVDAANFRILVLTVADAGTEMPSHSHESEIKSII